MNEARIVVKFGPYRVPVMQVGEGRPTLFLHGFDGATTDACLSDLADGRLIVAPIHPGFDGTSSDPDIHDMHNVVIFYLDLLDRLDIYEVDVIGHSLGGMFAAEIAAMVPSRVRRLVLVDPLGLWIDEAPPPDVLATGGSALSRLLWANPDSEVAAKYRPDQLNRTCNWAAASNYLWPIPDRGLAARAHRAHSPALLIRGRHDMIVTQPYLERFANLLPNAAISEIDGAGHLPMLENPVEFSRTVTAFLDS